MTKFKIKKSRSTPLNKIKQLIKNPKFGVLFTDHMAHAHYENGKWTNFEIVQFQNLSLSPAAAVFHYGQEIFEGAKAYKRKDGSVYTFRIDQNAKRFQASARRLALPELPEKEFVDSVFELVKLDHAWVPTGENQALYIRPFMIATEPYLGVRSSNIVDYYVILAPVGSYISGVANVWVEEDFFRAGPGGTGSAKCGGNYAASLLPKNTAHARGCDDTLYLDARNVKYIEEFSGMSFFAVTKNRTLLTPKISERILDSITRKSVIQLAKALKFKVEEKDLVFKDILKAIKNHEITEIFMCGTAAVITSVASLKGKRFKVQVGSGKMGPVAEQLKKELVGIQRGEKPDRFHWMNRIK